MGRAGHFASQGGADEYLSERADLAMYLVKNSTTLDMFKSKDDFTIPEQQKWIPSLEFKLSQEEFYHKVADFYKDRLHREVDYDKVKTFLDRY